MLKNCNKNKLRPARRLSRKQPENQLIGIKVGDTFRNRASNYKCHIIAITKDTKDTVITYRYYGKIKQWWHYDAISLTEFKIAKEYGTIV